MKCLPIPENSFPGDAIPIVNKCKKMKEQGKGVDGIMDEMKKKSHIGNFYEFLNGYYRSGTQKLSYLSGKWADFEQWKVIAKAKVFQLLSYFPEEASLEAQTLEIKNREGYRQEEIEFNTAKNVRIKGTLLVPDGEGKYPAIVALHDHSGFYYYGREKIVEQEDEPEILKKFKQESYSGRSWANEAAKRGYVVLCIDGFYFGSRKYDLEQMAEEIIRPYTARLESNPAGSDGYIELVNVICGELEYLLVKHIFMSGATWPGILFHDDRKSVDYLLTRKEVDKDRIGCCGLSLGGFRSAHLAALDPRIKCCSAAGWMPTFGSLLFNNLRYHTYMVYVPGLPAHMDLPDVASLTAPNPLFIQQCSRDGLYNMEGMQKACVKIGDVYAKLGISERFTSKFYDNKHEFNLQMQEDAFDWLDRWLK